MKTLDDQAEDMTRHYAKARAHHRPSKEIHRKLVDLRTRAIKATTRRNKAVSDLPLFQRVA